MWHIYRPSLRVYTQTYSTEVLGAYFSVGLRLNYVSIHETYSFFNDLQGTVAQFAVNQTRNSGANSFSFRQVQLFYVNNTAHGPKALRPIR